MKPLERQSESACRFRASAWAARALLCLAPALVVAMTARPAVAQEFVEPTETQRQYNDRGVELMFDGEFEQAAANFQSSLALGESNIAWLNFGRSMFKLGRCAEARDAYQKVTDSPAVRSPSPSELAGVLARFRKEWDETCTATVQLVCEEPFEVSIDGADSRECGGAPVPVTPGEHRVVEVGGPGEWTFTVVDGELAELPVEGGGDTSTSIEQSESPDPVAERPISAGRVIGLALGGAGTAALGTALVLDRVWVAPAFAEYEAAPTTAEWADARETVRGRQQVNRAVVFSGLGLLAVGATVALVSRPNETAVSVKTTGTAVALEVKW